MRWLLIVAVLIAYTGCVSIPLVHVMIAAERDGVKYCVGVEL
jgi:hypothetical protein